MASRHKKHILKAAKNYVVEKFDSQLQEIHEQIESIESDHKDEDGILNYHGAAECQICSELDVLKQERTTVEEELSEWRVRSKKNKRKVGKRVEWTNEREQPPTKTINHDVLKKVKASRKENNKAKVGCKWLCEGALVTRKGISTMMIVTQIQGNQVECLHNGTTQWFRNMSLRPAEWMMEE